MAKESLYGVGNDLIFRETFNDVSAIANNNGQATDLTFRDGKGIFNGSTSNILYQKLINIFKTHSIRLRFKSYDLSAFNSFFAFSKNYDLNLRVSSSFINYRLNAATYGASPSLVNNQDYEIIITRDELDLIFYQDGLSFGTNTLLAADNINFIFDLIGERGAARDLEFDGEMELIEVYDKVLTADEVLNLYKNEYYKKLNKPLVYSLSPINGYLDSQGEDIDIVTGVTLERKGQISVSRCDGTTSNITLANSINLGTQFSFFVWANLIYKGDYHCFARSTGNGYILQYNDNTKALGTRDGVSNALITMPTALDIIGNWGLIGIVRDDTDCKFYFNGEYLGNATLATNNIQYLPILFQNSGGAFLKGDVGEMFVYGEVLTDSEVSQLYTNTKFKYIG